MARSTVIMTSHSLLRGTDGPGSLVPRANWEGRPNSKFPPPRKPQNSEDGGIGHSRQLIRHRAYAVTAGWFSVTNIHAGISIYFCAERRRFDGWFGGVSWQRSIDGTVYIKSSGDTIAPPVRTCAGGTFVRHKGWGRVDGIFMVAHHPPYDHGSRSWGYVIFRTGVKWSGKRFSSPLLPWHGWRAYEQIGSEDALDRAGRRQTGEKGMKWRQLLAIRRYATQQSDKDVSVFPCSMTYYGSCIFTKINFRTNGFSCSQK